MKYFGCPHLVSKTPPQARGYFPGLGEEEVRGSKTPGPPGSTSYVELAIFVDRDLHRQAVLL